jgi:hypothetical protein
MNIDSSIGKPRFQVGDVITLVGPGFDHREEGNLIGVITDSVEHIHRYHVRFPSGKSATFFGFELQLLSPHQMPDRDFNIV